MSKINNGTPSDTFRRRLRQVREQRNLTHRDLSERLDAIGFEIPPQALSRLETGRKKSISLDDAFALAFVLNVSPLFLFLDYAGESREYEGKTVWLSETSVAIGKNMQRVGVHMLRPWLRGAEPLPGQSLADFYGALPPDELSELLKAARAIETGNPAPPGAAALRKGSVIVKVDAQVCTLQQNAPGTCT
jgi:transcriptional regulator with XRE-family HTH domain